MLPGMKIAAGSVSTIVTTYLIHEEGDTHNQKTHNAVLPPM